MKIDSVQRILMITAVTLLGSVQLAHAKGNFIPYPISCTAIDSGDQSVEISVSIFEKNGFISGLLVDNGDQANLKCQEVSVTGFGGNYLDCVGQWASDGSAANFSTPLFTYTPMTSIKRSSSVFGAKTTQGICISL